MQDTNTNQLRWLYLTVIIIILDQLSKWLVSHYLTLNQPVEVLPVFNLLFMQNTGAAFSFLRDAGGWQRWLFILIAVGISAIILRALHKCSRNDNISACAMALILGGALGNLYDRAVLGYVVDFISLHAGTWYFATCNIADTAITFGVIIWLCVAWRKEKI